MQYDEAVSTLLDVDAIYKFFLVVIALLVLFILIGQGIKLWRELFGKPKEEEDKAYADHLQESEKRFREMEQHIKENNDNIADLMEWLRVSCMASMALLNHAIHNGNTDEMEKASSELNTYLINRK